MIILIQWKVDGTIGQLELELPHIVGRSGVGLGDEDKVREGKETSRNLTTTTRHARRQRVLFRCWL